MNEYIKRIEKRFNVSEEIALIIWYFVNDYQEGEKQSLKLWILKEIGILYY